MLAQLRRPVRASRGLESRDAAEAANITRALFDEYDLPG
jgi:hypothetical protein